MTNEIESTDYLIDLDLILIDGMVFLKAKGIDHQRVSNVASSYGKVGAQKYLNHKHLFPHIENLTEQRQWAFRILDSLRKKCEVIYPGKTLLGEIKDDGFELEITVWVDCEE